jgi:CheY-like chemotaxis protein
MDMRDKPYASTVMLIDDNRIDNIVNKKVLEKEKVAETILVFNKANQALDYLKDLATMPNSDLSLIPSMIFIDVVMPEMNGVEFIRQYIHLPAFIRHASRIVLISSSLLSPALQAEMKGYGVSVAVVGKPLSKASIDTLLHNEPS